jgi:hypothetical protein
MDAEAVGDFELANPATDQPTYFGVARRFRLARTGRQVFPNRRRADTELGRDVRDLDAARIERPCSLVTLL